MKEKLITRKQPCSWETGNTFGKVIIIIAGKNCTAQGRGTYFIYGKGGALSSYARYIGGSATGGADFQVLSDREAKEWAEKKLSAEEYCKIFGEPEEG